MFIEGLRTDSLYVPGTIIRISQLVGFLCFVGCGSVLLALTILTRKRERLLVLEDAAFEAAKRVEAELAEGQPQNTADSKTQNPMESVSDFFKKVIDKIKGLFQKETGENDNGNEN